MLPNIRERNWIADRLTDLQESNQFSLGALRRRRNFDINNYERAINDITARVTSDKSQRLAVAQAAGFNTSGLIVGGQRDTTQLSQAPGEGINPAAFGLKGISKSITEARKEYEIAQQRKALLPQTPYEKRLSKKGLE